MSEKRRSISDGLSAMAMGSILSSGGVAAGVEAAEAAASKILLSTVPEDQDYSDELAWDDNEEQNYRLWIRQMQDSRPQHDLNWQEFESEIAYRERLRCETEANSAIPIAWEDEKEQILRQKYIDLRKKRKREEAAASWDEQKAEADHRERIRQRQEANRKKPIVWDDDEERKCQERYRKKYNAH